MLNLTNTMKQRLTYFNDTNGINVFFKVMYILFVQCPFHIQDSRLFTHKHVLETTTTHIDTNTEYKQ